MIDLSLLLKEIYLRELENLLPFLLLRSLLRRTEADSSLALVDEAVVRISASAGTSLTRGSDDGSDNVNDKRSSISGRANLRLKVLLDENLSRIIREFLTEAPIGIRM